MPTVDEQFEAALARVKALEADTQAGANLLAEADVATFVCSTIGLVFN